MCMRHMSRVQQPAEVAAAKINFDSNKAHSLFAVVSCPRDRQRRAGLEIQIVREWRGEENWIYASVALNRKLSSRIYTFDTKFAARVCTCVRVRVCEPRSSAWHPSQRRFGRLYVRSCVSHIYRQIETERRQQTYRLPFGPASRLFIVERTTAQIKR